MEGFSSFDSPLTNPSVASPFPCSTSGPISAMDSIPPVPLAMENLQQFNYQAPGNQNLKDEVAGTKNTTGIPGPSAVSQTSMFLDDVRKRWQQHVAESGPPAKIPRTDSAADPSAASAETDDKRKSDDTSDSVDDQPRDRKGSSAIAAPPIPRDRKLRRPGGKGVGASSDYSNSDDDKPDPPTPKSEGSNYEPSSAPTSDSEDGIEADEGLSEEADSGDEYKPRKPKINIKKKAPVIGALAFLASNRRRRSSNSGDESEPEPEPEPEKEDEDSGSQSGKALFRSKNSFEMLRRLREMKAKKRDIGHESKNSTAGPSDSRTEEETVVYRIYMDRGDSSPSSSAQRRSSLDDKNVNMSITEKYALSRKRQVLLSDDEDTNSNSNSDFAKSSAVAAKEEKTERISPVMSKRSTGPKKRVVYSSDDKSSGSDDGEDDEDDDDGDSSRQAEEQEKPQFQVVVSKKPTKTELQEMCVKFFNEADLEQLSNLPRCSERVAEALISLRPFKNFDTLLDKMDDVKVKGSSTQIVLNHLQVVEWQNDLDRLLQACQRIADHLQSSVDELLAGETATVSQPATLSNEYSLKPYQVLGLNWLILMYRTGLNAVLADEMGLGKTIQVIAFLAYLKEQNVRGPHIVVVPSSTMDNWLNEFRRWCPTLNVLTYYGSMDDRKFLRKEVQSGRQEDFDVLLSTYRVITSHVDDRAFFKKLNVGYAVFDEAHMLKSCNTARYKSLMKVKAKHRLLLTGTPLQNNLVELVSLLYFVMPTLFRDHTEDLKDILSLFQTKNGSLGEYEQEKIEQAKQIMKPFVLRRLKSDVLSQLPEKHDRIEVCDMTGRQAELYGSLVTEYAASVSKGDGDGAGDHSATDTKGMFMQLRKVANHPLLVRSLYTDDVLNRMAKALKKEKTHKEIALEVIREDLSVLNDFRLHQMCKQHRTLSSYKLKAADIEHSGKFKVLDRILPETKAQGNKVLLFSQFTMVLDVMEEFLKMRRYKYLRLDGSTPVVERQLMIDKFNNTPALFAFLLSTRAGGLGINLTSANTIILHDIDYNPYNDKQAEDRCHRVGQTKEVTVIRLIAKNTVDETMLACAQRKLQLEQQITGADQEDDENSRDVESLLKQALKL